MYDWEYNYYVAIISATTIMVLASTHRNSVFVLEGEFYLSLSVVKLWVANEVLINP